MKDWERLALPHAVYRVFDGNTLLYVGCSIAIGTRLAAHADKPWYRTITRIDVEWFDNEPHAKVAEAKAVKTEHPKFNKQAVNSNNIANPPPARNRGDGLHCPRCGKEKVSRKMTYCRECTREYQKNRRALLLGT